jgi:hypothetical protein
VPKQQWLEFELVGTVPSGPAARLSVSPDPSASHGVGYFAHSSPQAGPLSITRAGKFRLGPVGESRYLLHLFVPSRTRVGTGTTIELGDVAPDRGRVAITLPELKTRIVQGRVEFPTGVPSERLALLATAVLGPRSLSWLTDRPNVAGIDADGRFAIDLPTGSYHLQLVDLLTSVVFHTETDDLEVDEHTSAIILQPQIHWLEVECSPQHTGDEVLVQSIGVTLPRPRNGACSAFLQSWSRSGEVESGSVEFRLGAEKQRWLVPAGQIEIRALQNFQILHPWAQDYRGTEVDSASLDIDKPEQRVTLTIPPPPSDEELLRRQ